jgi:glycosyltransferase involved in cell wall biosynthesis
MRRIVVYDYQAFAMQRYGGISRYFAQLIAGLKRSSQIAPLLPVRYADNRYLREILGTATPKWPYAYHRTGAGLIQTLATAANQRAFAAALSHHEGSILHPTYYDPYVLDLLDGHRFVTTIHDMTYELFDDLLDDSATLCNKRLAIEHADAIIAVSHNTKRDLIRFYPEAHAKTVVIPHGVDMGAPLDRGNGLGVEGARLVEEPYVLFVGARDSYKNFAATLAAFSRIAGDFPDLHLICAGGLSFGSDERVAIEGYGLSRRVRRITPTDAQLTRLYGDARAFVFPSLYEGFGLPVLEAMACETPCILSEGGALREVAGDAARYFDPTDVDAQARALGEVLADEEVADALRRDGFDRARAFTWEESVRAHEEVYLSL